VLTGKRSLGLIAGLALAAWASGLPSAPAVLAQAVGTTKAATVGPFFGMKGAWTGAGTVTASDGSSERIKCRVNYTTTPVPVALHQSMRCASASYAFDIVTDIESNADGIFGRWSELTRNVTGDFTGRVMGDTIEGQVMGFGFSVGLAVLTRGDQQAISIRAAGAKFTDVAITLKRDGP